MTQEDERSTMIYMSPSLFISEILLIFMGFAGISVVGVNLGYLSSIPLILAIYGLFVGLLTFAMCVLGLHIILYQSYRSLKYYLAFMLIFLFFQLSFLFRLHFFTDHFPSNEGDQAFTIVLDVCFVISFITVAGLGVHFKEKGSTIEMVKL